MSYQVLARKWRPQNFIELAGQDHVLQALVNALTQQRLHHAYLFTGTRGVGKTTIARIFAKCLNCETNGISPEPCGTCGSCVEIAEGRFVDLIEVDAASRTKVEDTRELLENVQYTPTRGRFKVYLIDEVHMLSTHSFNALLKTLEEPPAHVKFLLATTDPQKLPVTILSRCLQFNLKNMSPGRVVNYLEKILGSEQLSYDEAGLWQIGQAANGSMRDALSLTDQAIAFGNGHISESDVTAMLGLVNQAQVVNLLDTLVKNDASQLLKLVNELAEYQPDFVAICASLLDLLHRIAIEQQVPGALEDQLGDLDRVKAIAQSVSSDTIQMFYQSMLIGKRDLPLAHSPKAGFEMLLLRLMAFRPAARVNVSPDPVTQIDVSTSTESLEDKDASIVSNTDDKSSQDNDRHAHDSGLQENVSAAIEVVKSIEEAGEDTKEVKEHKENKDLAAKNIAPKSMVEDASVAQTQASDARVVTTETLSNTPDTTSTASINLSAGSIDAPLSSTSSVSEEIESELSVNKASTEPPFVADEKPKVADKATSSQKMAEISQLMQATESQDNALEKADASSLETSEPPLVQEETLSSFDEDEVEDESDEIPEVDGVGFDRSAELVAVMQSQAISPNIDNQDSESLDAVDTTDKAIATNDCDLEYSKAEIIVQPALGLKLDSISHFSELTMQMWWLIAPRLPLTGLVQNILMNSCMLEAGVQGIKLEVPLEYGHMLNQVRYEQIQGAVSQYFDETVPLIIDTVADVSGVTAEEFAASKRAQAMQEAIDHLNAHPIVQGLSSTMGGQLIYDSVKIKA